VLTGDLSEDDLATPARLSAALAELLPDMVKHYASRLEEHGPRALSLYALTLPGRVGSDRGYNIIRDFNVPFVRAANRVRVYGSPASIAAMDEIQEGFAKLNRAEGESEREAAHKAIRAGHDHLVIAARADVGPRNDDQLKDVPFGQGAGPSA
jgi:hypothetical protein